MSNFHTPVMPEEVIKYLDIKPGRWYLDCNLGGGGHTELILKMGGKVIGIDLDPAAISFVILKYNLSLHKTSDRLFYVNENLIICQANFAKLKDVLDSIASARTSFIAAFQKDIQISGVLFDLGVSSFQLETAERGFSFNLPAKLDMRMDKTSESATAADLINGLHEKELSELFWKLGEERFNKQIARKIVEYRKGKRVETTAELADIVLSVRPRMPKDKIHPATKVFQALRIAVNDEINSLKEALPQAVDILEKGGKLVVFSFHSLEDRIVKDFMKVQQRNGRLKILTEKPLTPTRDEIRANPRSRSAKLRAAVKT